jgi:hypothetical protein
MKLTTGIPKMDEILNGGIGSESCILLLADPMVDVSTFCQQIVSHRIVEGDKIIYLTTNKLPEEIRKNMYEHGFNTDNIVFIDCISFTAGKESEAPYVLKRFITDGKGTWEEVKNLWRNVLKNEEGYKIAVWDCLETFMGFSHEIPEFIEECKKLNEETKTTAIFILTNWGYKEEELKGIKESYDLVINLATISKGLTYLNYYKVEDSPAIPFKITLTGVNLYIPKILVTGPFNAGKSTLVRQLSETAVSIDRLGTTIALDHGYVEKKGIACNLFATPGQDRFDWIMKVLSKDVWGVILVVDSTQPETFPRALEMLKKVEGENIPFIVFANKQDVEGALKPEEVKERLGVPIVVGGSALKGENTDKALSTLFEEILKRSIFR